MADATVDLSGDGGVTKKVLRAGTGKAAPNGVEVRVHYVGTFPPGSAKAGEVFDSSRAKGREFKFPLGAGRVIKGWDLGVASMNIGELCVLTCGPNYAYGARGAGAVIPPNATLQFEVELLGFEGDGATAAGPKCTLA